MPNLDLTVITGLITAASAFASLAVMQVVTREAGFACTYGRLHYCQRFLLAALAAVLMYDCYDTVSTGSDPRWSDFYVHIVLLANLVFWAYRKGQVERSPNLKTRSLRVLHNLDSARKPTKFNDRMVDQKY